MGCMESVKRTLYVKVKVGVVEREVSRVGQWCWRGQVCDVAMRPCACQRRVRMAIRCRWLMGIKMW